MIRPFFLRRRPGSHGQWPASECGFHGCPGTRWKGTSHQSGEPHGADDCHPEEILRLLELQVQVTVHHLSGGFNLRFTCEILSPHPAPGKPPHRTPSPSSIPPGRGAFAELVGISRIGKTLLLGRHFGLQRFPGFRHFTVIHRTSSRSDLVKTHKHRLTGLPALMIMANKICGNLAESRREVRMGSRGQFRYSFSSLAGSSSPPPWPPRSARRSAVDLLVHDPELVTPVFVEERQRRAIATAAGNRRWRCSRRTRHGSSAFPGCRSGRAGKAEEFRLGRLAHVDREPAILGPWASSK